MENESAPSPTPVRPPSWPPPLPAAPAPMTAWGPEGEPTFWQKVKKFLGPLGVVIALCVKFLANIKFFLLPVLKFFPVFLKTGGTMILSVGVYAMAWGFWFALGF